MARRVRTQLVTVLFTDIIGSTKIAAELGDRRWKALLEAHHAITRDALRRYRGDEIDTAGDGFFAVFDKQAQAIHCAVEIVERVRDIGLEVRAGLHVGEAELIGGKVGGVAVHTGARVGSIGGPGQVVVSSVLRELVPGSGIEFKDLGTRRLKGLPEPIRLWSVRSIDGKDIPAPLAPDDAAERRAHIPVGPSRRAAFVAGSVAGLAVLGIAGYLAFGRGPSTPTERPAVPIQPKTLLRIDPATMQIETRLELSGDPIDVEFSLGRVWVLEEGILEVLTPGAPEFDRIGLGFEACSLARSERGVIVGSCSDSRLYRVGDDLRVRPLTDTPADGGFILPRETSGGLWVLSASLGEEEDRLYHVDPATGDVLRTVPLPDSSGPPGSSPKREGSCGPSITTPARSSESPPAPAT
jgi:class 3 adenylate cyclase